MRSFFYAFWFMLSPTLAAETFYSPEVNLREIDLKLINSANTSIDLAAFEMTDDGIIAALYAAQARGVVLRLIFNRRKKEELRKEFKDMSIYAKLKATGKYMHLKSYVIDGRIKRAGSANFSKDGLTKQDNDLTLDEDPLEIARFKVKFEAMWEAGQQILPAPPYFNGKACEIKGNVTKAKEKHYYLPNTRAYGQIIINNENDNRYFCTEEEAIAAGFLLKRPKKEAK